MTDVIANCPEVGCKNHNGNDGCKLKKICLSSGVDMSIGYLYDVWIANYGAGTVIKIENSSNIECSCLCSFAQINHNNIN